MASAILCAVMPESGMASLPMIRRTFSIMSIIDTALSRLTSPRIPACRRPPKKVSGNSTPRVSATSMSAMDRTLVLPRGEPCVSTYRKIMSPVSAVGSNLEAFSLYMTTRRMSPMLFVLTEKPAGTFTVSRKVRQPGCAVTTSNCTPATGCPVLGLARVTGIDRVSPDAPKAVPMDTFTGPDVNARL